LTKVLLIYPYFQTGKNKDTLFHPLGIAVLSAKLKALGIHVMTLYCTFMTPEEAEMIAFIYKPDITGIYVMTTMTKNALGLLDKIKESNEDSIYVAGGPLPTLYPAKFAKKFDFVFQGEAAISFPEFCLDYSKSQSTDDFFDSLDVCNYPGIFSEKYGPMEQPVMHLSEMEINAEPIPDRSGFDHETYQRLNW